MEVLFSAAKSSIHRLLGHECWGALCLLGVGPWWQELSRALCWSSRGQGVVSLSHVNLTWLEALVQTSGEIWC